MTKTQAIKIQEMIESLCKREKVWYEVTKENRPNLGKIKIELSIKVDGE